jgi:hypothetical protein
VSETRKAIFDRVRERNNEVVAMLAAAYRQPWRYIRNGRYKREALALLALNEADLDSLPPPTKREREREQAKMMGFVAYRP